MMEVETEIGMKPIHADSFFSRPKRSITLKFEEVAYKVDIKGRGRGQEDTTRTILHGISGAVRPGEMLAMMGPSGSGKTTLLTILGGRLASNSRTKTAKANLTGNIGYNGQPFSSSLSRCIGFVTQLKSPPLDWTGGVQSAGTKWTPPVQSNGGDLPCKFPALQLISFQLNQDDVLHPHLTVFETLLYTALLRLPSSIPKEAKTSITEAVISELGLNACRNNIIGGPFVRGVSGGERKRVSVGQELLINPSLVFLDEPTSGLDSTTAGRIVSTLLNLTKSDRAVVLTIHQPSSSIFYMFHKVLILSDGHLIYFGDGSSVMRYFARIGYEPRVPMNPADFLLDLANGVSPDQSVVDREGTKGALISAYRTELQRAVEAELREVDSQLVRQETDKNGEQWCTSWWTQFTVLLERGLKERRHEKFTAVKIAEVILPSLLAGALWFQSEGHVQDQLGLLFFLVGFWNMTPVFGAVFTFPQERLILTKERSSRMYCLSSYFMSRTLADLPMELIMPTISVTIAYWMGGLRPDALSFFAFLLITLLAVLVSQGVGLAIGAFITDLKAASILASVVMLSFMMVGGFFVQNIPGFMAWLKYISISFYMFKMMVLTQFVPTDTFQCGTSSSSRCNVKDLPPIESVGFDRHKEWAIVALVLMLFFYRLLAYIGLRRVGVIG